MEGLHFSLCMILVTVSYSLEEAVTVKSSSLHLIVQDKFSYLAPSTNSHNLIHILFVIYILL